MSFWLRFRWATLVVWAMAFTGGAASAADAPAKKAKVVLIGVDGVSLNLLEPYMERGLLPNFSALVKQGARGDLDSIWPLRTPQVWTSAVTGKLAGQHGIWDHLSNTYYNPKEVRTAKKKRVTSEHRRSKALWQLLGDRGLKTLTVGWMASWPAEKVAHGIMVAPIELIRDKRQTTIKGSFYKQAKRMVTPRALTARVNKLIVDPSEITREALLPFSDLPKSGSPLYALPYLERYVYGLRWSLARARSVDAITVDLARSEQPDVVLSYFQCSDSLLHRFWIFQKDAAAITQRLKTHGLPQVDAQELHRRFGNVVKACYQDLDLRLGHILEATRDDNTLVLVASDHGFGHAPIPHKLKGEPYSGDHLDEGVILAAGPGIKAGSKITGASILDLTPTILHHLGFEVADDMRGKVLSAIADTTDKAVKRIPTYENKPQTEAIYPEGWPPRKAPKRSVHAPEQWVALP